MLKMKVTVGLGTQRPR